MKFKYACVHTCSQQDSNISIIYKVGKLVEWLFQCYSLSIPFFPPRSFLCLLFLSIALTRFIHHAMRVWLRYFINFLVFKLFSVWLVKIQSKHFHCLLFEKWIKWLFLARFHGSAFHLVEVFFFDYYNGRKLLCWMPPTIQRWCLSITNHFNNLARNGDIIRFETECRNYLITFTRLITSLNIYLSAMVISRWAFMVSLDLSIKTFRFNYIWNIGVVKIGCCAEGGCFKSTKTDQIHSAQAKSFK